MRDVLDQAAKGTLPGLVRIGVTFGAGDGRLGRRYGSGMTAKDKLRSFIDELSEAEAAAALDFLVARRGDALTQLLESAPIDDEPTTPEEEALVQEARDALARGETVSLDEIRAELS